MAKEIKFEYKGTTYRLGYQRSTIKQLSRAGITPENLAKNPLEVVPGLFAAAFKMHHRKVTENTIEEIFKTMSNKEALMTALIDLYNEPISNLLDEPDDEDVKTEWELN